MDDAFVWVGEAGGGPSASGDETGAPNGPSGEVAGGADVPIGDAAGGAMSPSGATPLGRRILVGRESSGYIYRCVADDGLLWRCERPSDVVSQSGGNSVLYLVWSPDDKYWYAIDADANVAGGVPAILQLGHPIFRTAGSAADAGSCNWDVNRSGIGRTAVWRFFGACDTVAVGGLMRAR